MKRVLLFFTFFAVLATAAQISYAQNTFKAAVQAEETKQPVAGARVSVRGTEISATTDAGGKVELANIPDGEQIIEIIAENYEIQELSLTFPLADRSEKLILLKVNEVGEVVISSTRTGREIDDEPTRVEAIDE
ncbi:MAG TPA: carboxypeptidase-like regulatory domain-containing protein, partial [Pyrinomonadaceae bacterium]